MSDKALDQAVSTPDDRERLLEYLRSTGGSTRRCATAAASMRGADVPASPTARRRYTPLRLSDLLGSRTGYYLDSATSTSRRCCRSWAAPIGCRTRWPPRLKDRITTARPCARSDRPSVASRSCYTDARGRPQKVHARLLRLRACRSRLLSSIDTDFSDALKKTIAVGAVLGRRQDGPAVQAAVLGGGRPDLRRRVEDRHGDRPDRLPFGRLPRARRACSSATTCRARRGGPSATSRRPNARRWRSSRARRSTHSTDRVRDRLLGGLAPRHLEQGLVVVGHPARRARSSAEPQRTRLLRRRSPEHERLDAGRLRVCTADCHCRARPRRGRTRHGPGLTASCRSRLTGAASSASSRALTAG